jgi:hypothetical protein
MPGQCSQAARYVASGLQTRAPTWSTGDSVAMPRSRDLPTTLEPSSLTVGEAGDFKCLRDPPQALCLSRPGLFSFGLHATGNAIQRLPLGAHASLSRIGSPAHPRNDCLSAAFLCPIPPPLPVFTAGAFAFFILSQSGERPRTVGARHGLARLGAAPVPCRAAQIMPARKPPRRAESQGLGDQQQQHVRLSAALP